MIEIEKYPAPIPNPEVKAIFADDTDRHTVGKVGRCGDSFSSTRKKGGNVLQDTIIAVAYLVIATVYLLKGHL